MTICDIVFNTESDTSDYFHKFAKQLRAGDVVALYGDLGVGKTFVSREIIHALCTTKIHVISPTFNLLQIYDAPQFKIFHFDLYRLQNISEVFELGIEEGFDGNVTLIEWPEIIKNYLPKNTINIHLAIDDNDPTAQLRRKCNVC